MQSHFGARRIRLGANVRKSELLEGHGGQVQHTGAARFFFSVNMVHVLVRVVGNAVVCLLKNFVPGPETQTIRRASLDTSRRNNAFTVSVALFEAECLPVEGQRNRLFRAVRAMRALLYFWGQRVPFRRGHSPRASPDAVAAADTLVRLVHNRTIGPALQSSCRAGGGARWL